MPSGLGLLTTDVRLVIQSWNRWLAAVSQIAESDAVGRSLLDLSDTASRERLHELFLEVLETGQTRVLASAFHRHLFRCAPQSPSRFFDDMQQLVTVAPLSNGKTTTGLLVTIEDVTPQRDRERALAERLARSGTPPAPAEGMEGLGASDWKLRAEAVRTLKQTADDDVISELLQSLERQHLDLNVLNSALQVLVASRRDVVAPLARLLDHDSANVRLHAAQALGLLHDRRAVSHLLSALNDRDTNVRFHALEALGRLRAPEAIEPLMEIAHSGEFFLVFAAIDALAAIDDPYVAPQLVGLLEHEMLRPAVVDALGAIGDEDAVAPLMGGLDAGTLEPTAVAAAITAIHRRYDSVDRAGGHIRDRVRASATPRSVERLIGALTVRREPLAPVVRVLGWVGTPACDALASVIGEPSVQAEVGDAIASLGSVAVDAVIARLQAGSGRVRLAAAALLGRLGDQRATPALIEAMQQGDSELTASAASALALLGDPRAFDAVVALFGDPQPAVRRAAIAAINSIGAPDTERRIGECLTDGNALVRECAVRVAGYFGFDRSAEPLARALTDDSEMVRRAAIEQLPFRTDGRGAALLIAAMHEETPRNKAAAAHALKLVEDAEVEAALLDAIRDPDPWVRYFAADTLGVHGRQRAVEVLEALVEHEVAPPVRIAALRSLSALDETRSAAVARRYVESAEDDLARAAFVAMTRAAGSETDRLLRDAVQGSRPALRVAAVEVLAARVTTEAVEVLSAAARLPVDPPLTAAVIEALGQTIAAGNDVVVRSAIDVLLDLGCEREWRSRVMSTIAAVPSRATSHLRARLADPVAAIRRVVVDGLARLHDPDASDAILPALYDRESSVRIAALSAVGRLGNLAAAPVVIALTASDPDPAVRRRAAMVSRRFGWQTAESDGR